MIKFKLGDIFKKSNNRNNVTYEVIKIRFISKTRSYFIVLKRSDGHYNEVYYLNDFNKYFIHFKGYNTPLYKAINETTNN